MVCIKVCSLAQTEELGSLLGKKMFGINDIVLLNGELGAGKTTLVRGVLAGAGGVSSDVTSPSYTYLNIYQANYPVYHLDVYLLDSFEDVYEIGIDELYNKGLIIIEWGGKFAEYFTSNLWSINISYSERNNERIITIKPPQNKIHLMKELSSIGYTNI